MTKNAANRKGFNLGWRKQTIANRLMRGEAMAKKRARAKSRQAYLDQLEANNGLEHLQETTAATSNLK